MQGPDLGSQASDRIRFGPSFTCSRAPIDSSNPTTSQASSAPPMPTGKRAA